MRRIKKRNLNTIRIKRNAYVKNVKDEEEVIVEEIVDITPERVTMEEKTEPVCADVAADVENSVEEAETEAEAAEEKAEAEVAEETVAEETEEVDVAEEVEPAEEVAEEAEATEEVAPAEEAEATEEVAPAEEVVEPVAEVAEETAEPAEEITEEKVVEDTVTITPDEVVFDEEEKPVAESEEADVEEAVLEAEAEETEPAETAEATEEVEEATEEVEEVTEEVEEVPLEASEEESEEILDEEGSLDGTEEEARALAEEAEEPAAEDEAAEEVEAEEAEETEAEAEEEKPAEKTEKEAFKLTAPANQDDILSRICVKRGRKLIYRPNEIIFNCTAAVTGTDKNNEEGIKIKNILDEEIKQGVKLGYIDKYDGLKMSEIKEEYENDVVYEYAEQEFKRVGLVLEGEKVKVYVYDWDMKALHHIGFVDQANVEDLKPYLENRDKYSFDVCGLITGGKFRKVIKDEASGKITVEKGNDGKLGVELDISIINRKD